MVKEDQIAGFIKKTLILFNFTHPVNADKATLATGGAMKRGAFRR
jgi:hypothetical protein